MILTTAADALYKLMMPALMRTDPQAAHDHYVAGLRLADDQDWVVWLMRQLGTLTRPHEALIVGGVHLPQSLILAAGMVKGDGFSTEAEAVHAVRTGENIIPGWRSLPSLLGPVEFGSYTRYPRVGNPGRVLWRDSATRSTQNRIGLKNPGAAAAAMFMHWHHDQMPQTYGINIAVSPGVDDPAQEKAEALEALALFKARPINPSWYTLNLSCPNTEDDPHGNQTEAKARDLCGVLVEAADGVPLWVKISPGLSDTQYAALASAFAEVGVRAVIATNTQGEPTPDGTQTAGVGGGRLHPASLAATQSLCAVIKTKSYPLDVIGCGGVLDGKSLQAYHALNVRVVHYYSAMIYRSPLAAAIIHQEAK